ncbi:MULTISPECIES: P-loop NTPase family protein [Thermococcus]|uniref:KaiC-like domain-containing protein n=1 Tax=Thermococcus barossii TaxID=54077 RepID=A0A2Z2MJ51_9EURY|nr:MULTISPECIES: hypothetical protein [Thermococcus]ASJ05559.1 hypothetical protein A3L01_09365 [Thermococcus barossii]NJE76714.1 hypothetical protein [Thermococcus sp. ES12]
MNGDVIKTGIDELDSMLGGGILDDSLVLVIYDTNSFGWVLGVEVFRSLVGRNGFGVVTNYSFPLSLLQKYGRMLGFDVKKLGESRDMAIIDVFSAVNGIISDLPFVYSPGEIDASTYLPKMVSVYYEILGEIGERKPIGLTITLDGFAYLFGEESTMKLLQKNLVMKESARISEHRKRPVNIFLLNRDRVSERFISWISQYSEHIIEFSHGEAPGVEKMVVRKSLLPDFEPCTAEFRFSRGKIRIVPERLEV